MKHQDPLDSLSAFYRSLDSIPTPPVRPARPKFWDILVVVLTPLAASLCAWLCIAWCAAAPAQPTATSPLRLSIALKELREFTAQTISQRSQDDQPKARKSI